MVSLSVRCSRERFQFFPTQSSKHKFQDQLLQKLDFANFIFWNFRSNLLVLHPLSIGRWCQQLQTSAFDPLPTMKISILFLASIGFTAAIPATPTAKTIQGTPVSKCIPLSLERFCLFVSFRVVLTRPRFLDFGFGFWIIVDKPEEGDSQHARWSNRIKRFVYDRQQSCFCRM